MVLYSTWYHHTARCPSSAQQCTGWATSTFFLYFQENVTSSCNYVLQAGRLVDFVINSFEHGGSIAECINLQLIRYGTYQGIYLFMSL